MVDDLAAVATCGADSIEINSYINSKIKCKKLNFSESKCKKLHISRQKSNKSECSNLEVENSDMKQSEYEKYLGDYIASYGSNNKNIEERVKKGTGLTAQTLALVKQITFLL